MEWVRLLRAGALLSCGWVACAVVVWGRFGPFWALLVMLLWLGAVVQFHRAFQALARAVRAGGGRAPG